MYSPVSLKNLYTLITLSALLATPCAAVSPESSRLIDAIRQAKEYVSQSHFDEAATVLERARAEAANHDKQYSEAILLDNLGLIYEKQAKYMEAGNALDDSIAILTRLKGEDAPDLIEPLRDRSHLFYESGENSRAETLMQHSLAIRKSRGETGEEDAENLGILGKIYLAESKFADAKNAAEESLQILKRIRQTDSIAAGLDYSILGAVYSNYREFKGAEESLKLSLSILQGSLKPGDYRVGEAMANLGLLYMTVGDAGRAEPLLDGAHVLIHQSGFNTMFTRQFITTYAAFEHKLGHKKKAKELDKEARQLSAASPETTFSRYVVDASSFR